MSKKDKLIRSIQNNPKDVSFEDLKKVLLDYGYEVDNSGGSHWVFRHEILEAQVVPRKKPLKAFYVIRALKAIGEMK